MFFLFKILDRVDLSLESLSLERGIIINTSPRCQAKSLMMGYPHYFLPEGIHPFKQTKKQKYDLGFMENYQKIFDLLSIPGESLPEQ